MYYCQPHSEEDRLCVIASLIMKKMMCVTFQPHCGEDIVAYFYKYVFTSWGTRRCTGKQSNH